MALDNDAPASGGDDLRSEIERAFATPSPEPAATEIIPDETAPVTEAAPVETEPQAQAEQTDTRTRDEKGRFAPKPADPTPVEAKPVQAKAPEPKPVEKPADYIPPPASWSDAEKTINWQRLPKPVQQAIAKRESEITEMERGFSGIAQVLAPRAQRLAAAYGSPEQALNTLFQLSDYADKDPAGFVTFFMQQRGLDPSRLFQQPTGQQPQQAAPVQGTGQPDPMFRQLLTRLHALESQQSHAAERVYFDQIEAFSRDPNRPHFNAVKNEMAALLQSGSAATLEDAYDRAVWANPMLRQELQSKELEKLEAERKAKADAARKAQQTNINGSTPVGLATTAEAGTLRGELERNWNASIGRV
jgi:hypothetical protein